MSETAPTDLRVDLWSEKDHKEFDPKRIIRIWFEKDYENLIQKKLWKFDPNKDHHMILVGPKSKS